MQNLNSTRSKVLELAHSMKSETMSFGKAQVKAWQVIRAKELMKNNVVEITYNKVNGEERKAIATLNPALLPVAKTASAPRKKVSNKVTYFDIEIGQFRSFLPQNFVGVQKYETILSVVQKAIAA